MPTVLEMATAFMTVDRPAGNLLDETAVLAQAINAARFYTAYGRLGVHIAALAMVPPAPLAPIDANLMLSDSEWAVIRPLFLLYVERETALHLEASRGLGLDVYGRASSEVAMDIKEVEQLMADRAFSQVVLSI